ncbi:MAG: YkoF family thiamine/hydroxymethylpyrimidine-binding protein [Thermodesulfobacteriota bacterium]
MGIEIAAQVSIYPLRQASLTPAIDAVREALERRGLTPEMGPMSTFVYGDSDATFAALRDAFEGAATLGAVVMSVTVSNACPRPGSPR